MDTKIEKKIYNIEEVSELVFQANRSLIKKMIFNKEQEIFQQKNLTVLKINEDKKLKGICIYQDSDDLRTIEEVCYIGKNKYIFLKFVRFIFKGHNWKYLRLHTLKDNHKLNKFYFKFGFRIVDEIESTLIMMYKRKK